MKQFALRIVVPVLNEGSSLTEKLETLQTLREQGAELVVVDGCSTDDSWARARPWADRLLASSPGRAPQMNLGAKDTSKSRASAILFLHADTQLPNNALELITEALKTSAWGRFDVQFDRRKPLLELVSNMMNWRSRVTGIATGDQTIFVNASAFHQVGGFPHQPLMEDIEISKRLKKISAPACVHEKITTSARRWERHGIWPTITLMWRLRWAYFWGAKPEELALAYGYASPPKRPTASVAILAKAPIPGLAKTRLIPLLGALGAARQQRRFLLDSLHIAHQAQFANITLWCAPDTQPPTFRALAKHKNVHCSPQPRGDLGRRMTHCMTTHFAKHSHPLLIMGTDCAVLGPGHLQATARSLENNDACVIPAEDGGYVLIGLRKPIAEVFENIDWSTERVLAQTRERLQQANATWVELPTLWDIDEPADWKRWQTMYTQVNKEKH